MRSVASDSMFEGRFELTSIPFKEYMHCVPNALRRSLCILFVQMFLARVHDTKHPHENQHTKILTRKMHIATRKHSTIESRTASQPTLEISPSCPTRIETHAPVIELYTRAVPSADAVTSLLPVELNDTAHPHSMKSERDLSLLKISFTCCLLS